MKRTKNPGQLVAKLRKVIGKSQTQFAAMIGVSKHTIISVENGRIKQLSKDLARRIQIATGAEILDEQIQLDYISALSDLADGHTLTPNAVKFLRSRNFGPGN